MGGGNPTKNMVRSTKRQWINTSKTALGYKGLLGIDAPILPEYMLSKLEHLTRLALKETIPNFKPIYNYRPDWLKNPKTGKNLEIDIYYPDLNLGIEVNGITHTLPYSKNKDYQKKISCLYEKQKLWTVKNNKDIIKICDRLVKNQLSYGLKKQILAYKPQKIKHITTLLRVNSRLKRQRKKEKWFHMTGNYAVRLNKPTYMSISRLRRYEKLQAEETARNKAKLQKTNTTCA